MSDPQCTDDALTILNERVERRPRAASANALIVFARTLRHSVILHEPPPDAIFLGFGDSSLDFELRIWTEDSLRTPQILKSNLFYLSLREVSSSRMVPLVVQR